MYTPWIVKHKPRSLSEIVGNNRAIQELTKWVKSWERTIPWKRAAFLYGPPGVGKTLCVEALANDLKLELVEKNASDYRTANSVQRFAGRASKYTTLFDKKRLVLLDEMDGITGSADRGGVRAITDIIKATRCPIILIANDAYNPRFSTLRRYCLLIRFEKPSIHEVVGYLREISIHQGIKAEDKALRKIVDRNEGDIRSSVNDLQALSLGREELTYQDVVWLAERDLKEEVFVVLRNIFNSKSCLEAKRAADKAYIDTDMLFEWIYENAPHQLHNPHDLAEAMEALALADLYRGRIRSTQNWTLLRYVYDFMTAGVAMARGIKSTKWVPFRFPERIRMLSRTRGARKMLHSIGMKISRKCHISSSQAVKEVLPYLKVIFENDFGMATNLVRWFNMEKHMVEYLADNRKDIISKIKI